MNSKTKAIYVNKILEHRATRIAKENMAETSVLFLDETDHFASEIIAVELEKVGSKE